MSYQIGICDDEIYQVKVNKLYLEEVASKNKYAFEYHAFSSGEQLKAYLLKKNLDVVLLDIDLTGESGIRTAAWISQNYPEIIIVFATGHREFAEEAFEVEATGYLVKPYDIKKMESVMKKVMLRLEKKEEKQASYEIVVTDENLKKKIDVRNILYIERCQSRSVIVTKQREYQVYETMSSLYDRIGEGFIRVNQGEIVNRLLIAEIKGNEVYLKDGKVMSIGRTYRKEVMQKYFG